MILIMVVIMSYTFGLCLSLSLKLSPKTTILIQGISDLDQHHVSEWLPWMTLLIQNDYFHILGWSSVSFQLCLLTVEVFDFNCVFLQWKWGQRRRLRVWCHNHGSLFNLHHHYYHRYHHHHHHDHTHHDNDHQDATVMTMGFETLPHNDAAALMNHLATEGDDNENNYDVKMMMVMRTKFMAKNDDGPLLIISASVTNSDWSAFWWLCWHWCFVYDTNCTMCNACNAHCWCSLLRSSLCFCGCLWLERLPRWCLWRLRLQRQHGDDEDDLDDYVYDFADHDDHKDLCHQNDDDYQVPLPRWWTMPSPLSDTELTQLRATFGWWVFVTVIIKMNYYDPDQNHKHQLHSWPCLLTAVIVMFKPFWLGMAMFLYLLMRIDSRIFPHRCASTASKSIKEIKKKLTKILWFWGVIFYSWGWTTMIVSANRIESRARLTHFLANI